MYFDFELDVIKRLVERSAGPRVVYDVGAADGSWTYNVSKVVAPGTKFELFEPLADSRPVYCERLAWVNSQVAEMNIHPIGLGASNADSAFAVFIDGYSSSFIDIPGFDQIEARISVPVFRLDDYFAAQKLDLPDFIKIDVQGFEMEVLKGAEKTIRAASWLLIETWLARGYGPRTVLLHELIEWLEPRGFFPNSTGGFYRGPTGRLESIDVLFASQATRDSGLATDIWTDRG